MCSWILRISWKEGRGNNSDIYFPNFVCQIHRIPWDVLHSRSVIKIHIKKKTVDIYDCKCYIFVEIKMILVESSKRKITKLNWEHRFSRKIRLKYRECIQLTNRQLDEWSRDSYFILLLLNKFSNYYFSYHRTQKYTRK